MDFEEVPISYLFVGNQHKMKVQEGVLKKHDSWVDLGSKLGGLEMQKQAFRIILVAKYKGSVFHEKASKMKRKRHPKMILKLSFGRARTRLLN